MKKKSPLAKFSLKDKSRWIKSWNEQLPKVVLGLTAVMVLQFFSNAHMAWTVREVAHNNEQVIDEMGQVLQGMTEMGGDLNEVRQFLLLPTKDYATASLLSAVEEEEVESAGEDPVVQIFEAIELIGEAEQDRERYEQWFTDLDAYLNATETLYYFERYGLYLRNGVKHHLADSEGTVFVTIQLAENGDLSMQTYDGQTYEYTEDAVFDDFKADLKEVIEQKLASLKEIVTKVRTMESYVYSLLTQNETLQAALSERLLAVGEEREGADEEGDYYAYDLLSQEGVVLLTIEIRKNDASLRMNGESFVADENDSAGVVAWIMEGIDDLEGRSGVELAIEELKISIASLQEDDGFNSILEKYGLTFNFEPTETETTIEYTLSKSSGEALKILYINKETGELMIKEPGADTGSLLSAMVSSEGTVMELPDVVSVQEGVLDSEDELNILIAGKHGMNVDTMILTNIDKANGKVSLISVPRDLYYNGRKINSVYANFGMGEFIRQLSDMTGRQIDKYILVDMYVFIDLVDLVGGIDVVLEEDLVDPTYKTYDNGAAGTLYYAAGEHHFNGVEALRIARSRHTTSDYSRAARQQLILEGLQSKAKNLGFGDATTVVGIIETVLEKTETNIGIEEAMAYYFRYQNYELNRGNVLSTANVLVSEQIPVNYVTSLRIDSCSPESLETGECQVQYALYSLAPRQNNWDYVRWYINEILED